MAENTRHIRDDLKGLLRGDLLFDDLSRTLYSTDASLFEIVPLGVVVPRDEEDLCALVRYAAEQEVPLVPRGAGTGLAGEALGAGLIVDLSRYMRAILAVGPDSVRVQPGVVYRELSAVLAQQGRRFAPAPSLGECTIGGMLATNASGRRALLHGYTSEHVHSLRVVLDSGEAATVGMQSRWGRRTHTGADDEEALEGLPARMQDILSSLATLLEQNDELIRKAPLRTPYSRCGYQLQDVLCDDQLDLPRLLVGSEGTLTFFTEATLKTIPLPGGESSVLFSFPSLEAALKASERILAYEPAACDLLDRRLLALGRTVATVPVPALAEAVILVEFEADSSALARNRAQELCRAVEEGERLAGPGVIAVELEERERLAQVWQAALPGLYGLPSRSKAVPFVEDIGVPPPALARYLEGARTILQEHDTTAALLVHAGIGHVHFRPFLDLRRHEEAGRLPHLAEALYELALKLGGTISSQHGTGVARTPWVARQFGPLYPLLREIKAIFDPRHLFNPGKIIASREARPGWPLRQGGGPEEREEVQPILPHPALTQPERVPLPLSWLSQEAHEESLRCNGCGECRITAPGSRMCPLFQATHREAATPRSKANLLRHLLLDGGDARAVAAPEVRALADLCVNCKMCERECPAHINIPRMMLEVKAVNVNQHGLDRSDWVLARTESFARLGSALAPLCNLLMANRGVRWLLEKLFGVARQRRLPQFAGVSFLRRAARRGWTRLPSSQGSSRLRVAYFVDIFANYNDPLIAESVVAVLHHNGIEVYVPPRQEGCGMAPLAVGDVETARETVQRNLRVLADLARAGYLILCSEPTAALMFCHDALDLLDDPDAQLVAQQTVEWTSFLWQLHQEGRLRTDFAPLEISVGHHVPCHLKALGKTPAGPALLSLIPGLRVHTIDVSCSGMAGTFGLKAANYAVSHEAGKPMLEQLARPGILFGSTECSTCRMQMEDGAGKRTLHPAEYLALAYGLLPQVAQRLQQPIRELVL